MWLTPKLMPVEIRESRDGTPGTCTVSAPPNSGSPVIRVLPAIFDQYWLSPAAPSRTCCR